MSALTTRPIGRGPLQISELGFGTASMGNLFHALSDKVAASTIDAALAAGLRYIDTAPYYGFGLSERRVGDRLRTLDRADFVISTKVGRLMHPVRGHKGSDVRLGFASPMPFEPVYDYSYDGIMRSFEDSLQRLGLSCIDILYVHDIGTSTHGAANDKYFRDLETGGYKALNELRRAGLISAFGLGVNEWQVCESAMEHGDYDCFLLAGKYTLLEQQALDSFIPKCLARGVTIVIGGAYNSGILATGTRHAGPVYYNYQAAPAEIIRRVAEIEAVCDEFGVSLPAAALQFPLANSVVSSVIPGLGTTQQVAQTISLYEEIIPSLFWAELKSKGLIREDAPTP